MKVKKFSKKLAFSKVTIANLGNGEMNDLKGGDTRVLCGPTLYPTGSPVCCITGLEGCISVIECGG